MKTPVNINYTYVFEEYPYVTDGTGDFILQSSQATFDISILIYGIGFLLFLMAWRTIWK
jgi:hypothetical protein